MSTDGILEYQGTKRVLFRGDTSNIVFDTRTTSLGIGVTGSNNPSSNLYITGNAYVSSNLAIGGVMTMGVVNVAARHNLQAVTDMGNVTTHTVEFTNPTTSIVASGNVVVTGNVVAGYLYGDGSNITGISSTSNLQVVSDTGNVTSNTIQFTNPTTSIVASGNVVVTGNVVAGYLYGDGSNITGISSTSNLQVVSDTGNVTSNTIQFTNATTGFVTTSRVGIKTTTPVATLHINGSLYNTAKIELLKRLVTITNGQNQLHPLQPGMQLYESDSRNVWHKYQFASDSEWLIGTLGSDMVNGGIPTNTDMTISFKANVTAFLIRNTSGWNTVSLYGWSSIGTFATFMSGYSSNFEIWARTFTQGTHSMNTYSAMYAFTI